MRNRKAQSAIEFLSISAGVLFFTMLFIFAIQSNISDKISENRDVALREVANNVVMEINLASSASDGYSRVFTLPATIVNGVEYNVSLQQGLVYATTADGRNSLALPVFNVNGSLVEGNNLIRKSNGVVYLNG